MKFSPSPSDTLHKQARNAAERFSKSREIWEANNRRFIRNVDVYLWRNRFQLMSKQAIALMAIETLPDNCGPLLERWQRMSSKARTVIRTIGNNTITKRQPFTISEIEVALPKNFNCSRKSLQSIVNRGVELELLIRECNNTFSITELFVDELFARVVSRDLDPDIVDWCRQVVMIDDMIKTAMDTATQEELGELFDSGLRTISERIDEGHWDEEIGYDRDV